MTSTSAIDCVQRARAAQSSWARLTVRTRCAALARLRVQIARRTDEIVQIIRHDIEKPALDALAGDIMVTLEQMRFYERRAPRILKQRRIGKPALFYSGARFYERVEPYGVVLVYSPYNYPFQLAVVPLISALVAGNAVILKCSDKTPQVAQLIADLCRAAKLPADLVQVLNDPPDRALALLDAGPDLVFFTGSTAVGRIIASRAAELLIPTILELGGKDPCIVFADCNLDRTIEGVVYGAFSNAGQVCVGIKRLYVEQSIYEVFVHKLTDRVEELRVGDFDEADLSVFSSTLAKSQLVSQVEDAISKGARIVRPKDGKVTGEHPTILADVPLNCRLMREETFGPVLCISAFGDHEEAIRLANAVPFALSASVWTRDRTRSMAVASEIKSGSCAVNDVIRNIANPYASFGGNGLSGNGRYHGPQGLLSFSRTKSLMVMSDRNNRERHWFPFARKTFNNLNQILKIRHSDNIFASVLRRIVPLLLSSLFILSVASQTVPHPGHLIVVISAPQHSHGQVGYLVFKSPSGFPNDKSKALKSGFIPIPPNNSQVTLDAGELMPGRYAVSVYQDVNGNQKLDVGFLGIPKEPVGASNNPPAHHGPPHFDECAFTMGRRDQKIAISLVDHHG